MRFHVRVSQFAAEKIARTCGPERSATGQSSEFDFWAGNGPLEAALIGFRDFGNLPFDRHPEVRTLLIGDKTLGPVLFVGVLIKPGLVEIADFEFDPDYWDLVSGDPDD